MAVVARSFVVIDAGVLYLARQKDVFFVVLLLSLFAVRLWRAHTVAAAGAPSYVYQIRSWKQRRRRRTKGGICLGKLSRGRTIYIMASAQGKGPPFLLAPSTWGLSCPRPGLTTGDLSAPTSWKEKKRTREEKKNPFRQFVSHARFVGLLALLLPHFFFR